MKSLMRWGTTVGIVGTAIVGSWFVNAIEALALPKEKVIERLQNVPVFTLGDSKGLVSTSVNGTNLPIAFISRDDAKKNIEAYQRKQPQQGKELKVILMSLGELYKLSVENAPKQDGLRIAFVPEQSQVELARKISRSNGQTPKYNGGVPLFVARVGQEGYLTLLPQKDKTQIMPFFFEKSQLQELLNGIKKQQPKLASTIKIEVVPLEGLIENLEKSENKELNQIHLEPTRESIQFVVEQMKQSQSQPRQ